MSYLLSDLTHVQSLDVTLAASAARTADGAGAAFEVGPYTTARLALVCSARSGTTPTLDVTVETSFDGITWRAHGTFAQITATGTTRKSFGGLDRYVRVSWVVGGTTPSFTFSVSGELV